MLESSWTQRLSIISDEAAPDFKEAVNLCLPLGIQSYELRLIHGLRVPYIPEDLTEQILHVTQERELKLTGISPGFCKIPVESPLCDRELNTGLDDSFRFMERLGVRRMNLFTYSRDEQSSQVPEAVFENLQRAIERCHSEGIEPVFENVPSCWGNTGQRLGSIAKRLNVRVVWDPANAIASGEEVLPIGYDALKDRIALVHIKNWRPQSGYVYIEDGVLDLPAQIKVLLEDGYCGQFCIESHRWSDPLATTTNTQQLLKILSNYPL
jgi:L-ribulose-5-phosphate 3-epimerase